MLLSLGQCRCRRFGRIGRAGRRVADGGKHMPVAAVGDAFCGRSSRQRRIVTTLT